MKTILFILFLNGIAINPLLAQERLEEAFPRAEMSEDLQVFRQIREATNSGLYKYRSPEEIDSAYQWAASQVTQSSTYLDFYNIILTLTDFEGSLHNDTELPEEVLEAMKAEDSGYFPYPIKMIANKVVVNLANNEIPLGAEIVRINDKDIGDILPHLHKYYTTDGFNTSGKMIGINKHFSKYYRLHYGQESSFAVSFRLPQSDQIQQKQIESTGYAQYYENFKQRHSAPFDSLSYEFYLEQMLAGQGVYDFRVLDDVAVLSVNSFLIGWNDKDKRHQQYVAFLDSCFALLADSDISNLIVDVRHNGGGTDPNDQITYSYLASEPFVENTSAWVSMNTVPYWKHFDYEGFFLLKPIAKLVYGKMLRKEFSVEKQGRFYQGEDDNNIPRQPSPLAFDGQVYLLISPRIASAGSMFAAMVASNTNAVVVGEETQGGYYGHNGHTPVSYILPHSKLITTFSIVNLEQDVVPKGNQPVGSGVRPDYEVSQSFDDFMNNEDTQMKFTLNLIEEKRSVN